MTEERTISITVDDGSSREVTRHYNVDNIAYLDVEGGEPSSILPLVFGIVCGAIGIAVTVVVIGSSGGTSQLLPGVLFIALSGLLLLYHFVDDDEVQIGTVTGEERLKARDTNKLQQQFLERSKNVITIEGEDSSLLSSTSYRYHFVPENIVRVERQQAAVTWREWAVIIGIVVIPVAIVNTWTMNPGSDIPITLAATGIVAVLVYLGVSQKDDGISIQVQSGDDRGFVMSAADARAVLSEFGAR